MSVTEMVIEKVRALPQNQARDLLTFLEKLEREEEAFDIKAARKALAEGEKKGFIPWEKIRAGLQSPKRTGKTKP
jgi:hypothetical protein